MKKMHPNRQWRVKWSGWCEAPGQGWLLGGGGGSRGSQDQVGAENIDSGTAPSGFQFQFCHFLAVLPWENENSTSLCFSFLSAR